MTMNTFRLVVGAALLLGAAPLATASHARCTPQFATVCSTLYTTCRTADGIVPVDLSCPIY